MRVGTGKGMLAVLCLALLALATPVSAQITTGTMAGTIQDIHGRRDPRGDGHADQRIARHARRAGRDECHGRLRVPEHDARYVHRRSDDAAASARCGGRASRSAAATASSIGALKIEPGGATETVDGHGRGAAHSGAERRTVVRRFTRRRSRACRLAGGRNFTALLAARPWRRARRRVGRRHAPRWRGPEQHHDGRHLGHGHGQQRPDAQHEHRVDRRGQGPHAGLPGRVRPVLGSADHGRHQERHEPVPRLVLRHRRQLGLEHQQLAEREERHRQAGEQAPHVGLLASAARRASRVATTSCSSSTATSTGRRTTSGGRSTGSACRPRSNARATSRSRSTTTACSFAQLRRSGHARSRTRATSSRRRASTRPASRC